MLKKGDRATIVCAYSKFDGMQVTLTSDPYDDVGDFVVDVELSTGELRVGCYYKYLRKIETIGLAKPTWKDHSDYSILNHGDLTLTVAYGDTCWLWNVRDLKGDVKLGTAIDRSSAKSDAEFFVQNYKPEDTSERDELRRKLERSWH